MFLAVDFLLMTVIQPSWQHFLTSDIPVSTKTVDPWCAYFETRIPPIELLERLFLFFLLKVDAQWVKLIVRELGDMCMYKECLFFLQTCLVIVGTNPAASAVQGLALDLSEFAAGRSLIEVSRVRTSASENCSAVSADKLSIESNSLLVTELQPQSVTTFVVRLVQEPASGERRAQ